MVVVVVDKGRAYGCALGGRRFWHPEFEGPRGRSGGVEWLKVSSQGIVFADYEVEEKVKRVHRDGGARL